MPNQELNSIKDFLLKTNPSKINQENKDDILETYINYFTIVKNELLYSASLTDEDRLFLTDTLSINILRSTQTIKNKKLDTSTFESRLHTEIFTEELNNQIFNYVVNFWAETGPVQMNALRDLFAKFMGLNKIIQDDASFQEMCHCWLKNISKIPNTLKVQYYLIEALSNDIDLFEIMEDKPDFFQTSLSLMNLDSLSTPISKCLVSMLLNIFKIHLQSDKSRLNEWVNLWKGSLLRYLGIKEYSKNITIYILEPLLKSMPKEAFSILVDSGFENNNQLLLSVIRLGQELNIIEDPFLRNEMIDMSTLEDLLKTNAQKLLTFQVLIYSKKSSKPIDPRIYHLVLQSMNSFFLEVDVGMRNYFWSSFKGLLLRVRDSTYALHRDANKLQKANKFPEEVQQKLSTVTLAREFLSKVYEIVIFHLLPGSSYQSHHLGLKFLRLFLELGIDKKATNLIIELQDDREFPFSLDIVDDKHLQDTLLSLLISKFPDIRESSRKLLELMNKPQNSKLELNESMKNDIEIQAAIYLDLYQHCELGASLHQYSYMTCNDKGKYMDSFILKIKRMLSIHDYNKSEFIRQPIGGYLLGLSSLMKQYFLLHKNKNDNQYFETCFDLVCTNWSYMKKISSYNSSNDILPESYRNCGVKDSIITTQAFRAIKEASGLLEILMESCELDADNISSIGDILIDQLFTVRHSGAFQAVLPAFKLCTAMAKKKVPLLLNEWLDKSIDMVETMTQHITRRSGGIPFIVSIILGTSADKSMLDLAFKRLVNIAIEPITEFQDVIDHPQVNAFNCIKSLFTEAKLATIILSHVSKSLELCLMSFTSSIWAIRNCSMMLFTAIQNRVFGKSGKDYPARLFFNRFVDVDKLLLESLNKTTTAIHTHSILSDRHIEVLYLIVTLLSRLESTPGYTGLADFISLLKNNIDCKDWKVRDLIARTLAKYEFENLLSHEFLLEWDCSNQNNLHGKLLFTKYCLQQGINKNLEQFKLKNICVFLISKLDETILRNKCYITIKECTEIVLLLLESNMFDKSEIDQMCSIFGMFLCNTIENPSQDGTKQLALAATLQLLLQIESQANIQCILQLVLLSNWYECHLIAMQYINSTMDLSLYSDEMYSSVCTIAKNNNNLPEVRKLALKTAVYLNFDKSLQLILSVFENNRVESLRTQSIEQIGNYITAEIFEKWWPLLQDMFLDNQIEDIRLSALRSVINAPQLLDHPEVVFRMLLTLNDDDEDIRLECAHFINRALLAENDIQFDTAPYHTAISVMDRGKIDAKSTHQLAKIVMDSIINDMNKFNNVENTSTIGDHLFDKEEDNIFRNRVLENMIMVKIIACNADNELREAIKTFLISYCPSIISIIANSHTSGSLFHWVTHIDHFTKIYTTRLLLSEFCPEDVSAFDSALIKLGIPHNTIFTMKNIIV